MAAIAEIKPARYGRGAAVIAAVTVVVAGFLLIFGAQAIQRIQAVENQWALYSREAAEADRLLHHIAVEMGYGGFIHNFKNYILRRDPTALALIEDNRITVETDLRDLQHRIISDEEKAALADIRAAFMTYDAAVDRARTAFDRGLSSAEVDILIQVDDQPALAAFATLDRSFKARSALARGETEKALQAASSMVLLLLVVVPVVILLGVMLVLFLRRIVDGNAKLQEVRDELGTLLRQAPDAILHVAPDGAIVRVNDQAEALFGYPRNEFLNLSVEDLIPNQFREGHPAIRDQAFEGMRSRPIAPGANLMALTKDGREVPVEISLSFAVSGGRRIATAIIRDITERKRAEEALKHAHLALEQRVRERTIELERRTHQLEAEMAERHRAENQLVQSAKMATIGEMASGITHELNQPMNIMRMGVEAAQIRIQRGQASIAQLSETLKKVEDQIARMSDIITHMRAYSRLDTEGQMPFDPVLAVEAGCKLFAAQLQGDDIQLIVNLPEHALPVRGHVNRLEQVMLNLLSNARDAILSYRAQIPASPSSQHEARITASLRESADGKYIVIEVEDTGGGVPMDVLPHIFAPFVTTKESGRGTGLGLSISFGIVQGMNGTIDAANRPDGACFTIHLPTAAKEHVAAAKLVRSVSDEIDALPFARAGGVEKVMVVDDEVGAAHSLSDFLQEMGYLVYTAYDGREALHLYDSDPVDVVITDFRMPRMGGAELLRELRKRSPDLPVMMMTGQGGVEGMEAEAGEATELWRKPLSLADVAQRLRHLENNG